MSVLDRTLNLVQTTLDEFDSLNYKLSSVLRKAIRIARLRNDYENLWWLQEEMLADDDKEARNRIQKELLPHYSREQFEGTKRSILQAWLSGRSVREVNDDGTLVNKDTYCSLSVPEIEGHIERLLTEVDSKVPPPGMHPLDLYNTEAAYSKVRTILRLRAEELSTVLKRIEHRVHEFLSITEKQLAYGQINSDIFERNRQYVDSRLRVIAPESLEQLVVAYRRVEEGDSEAGSHALLSCRRVLKSLADRLYPARKEPIIGSDGQERRLTDDKYIARLWQFVAERVKGRTAGDLLLAQVNDTGNRIDRLYDLDNKGVHADVTEFEVNQAVIQTYLLVGDILRLVDQDSALYSEDSA